MPSFGLTTLRKVIGQAVIRLKLLPPSLSSVPGSRGWWPIVREAFAGAWQRNIEISTEQVVTHSAVYRCLALISGDISKLRIRLMFQNSDGIWVETESPAFSPVLRKPNRYQTRIEFIEAWMLSKLIHGNTYVLKVRDERRVVVQMHILDPLRCKPLVAVDGSVFYALGQDNLTQVQDADVVVPASEIIHDKGPTFYHPFVGVSPLTACGLAALQGLRVQHHSSDFFVNGANPGGLLIAKGPLSEEEARNLQRMWESNYGGANAGRVAVVANGLEFKQMSMSAVDAQLIEQLKWTAEDVCRAFGVPAYMAGVGPMPSYNNVEALNQQYYSQCLQKPIESLELLLDEGLGLDKARTSDGQPYGTEFEIDDLLRMDTPSRVKAAADAIGSGGMSPNEARQRYLDLGPVVGGATPYLQQQNYSLAALAKRDAQPDPFGTSSPSAPAPESPAPVKTFDESDAVRLLPLLRKELAMRAA